MARFPQWTAEPELGPGGDSGRAWTVVSLVGKADRPGHALSLPGAPAPADAQTSQPRALGRAGLPGGRAATPLSPRGTPEGSSERACPRVEGRVQGAVPLGQPENCWSHSQQGWVSVDSVSAPGPLWAGGLWSLVSGSPAPHWPQAEWGEWRRGVSGRERLLKVCLLITFNQADMSAFHSINLFKKDF